MLVSFCALDNTIKKGDKVYLRAEPRGEVVVLAEDYSFLGCLDTQRFCFEDCLCAQTVYKMIGTDIVAAYVVSNLNGRVVLSSKPVIMGYDIATPQMSGLNYCVLTLSYSAILQSR